MEILSRLASGPLLAHRDACLAVTDLDTVVKQSVRVQPIKSSTILGKSSRTELNNTDGLTHRSLQMVIGYYKQQR